MASGLTFACLHSATAATSGGHLNPAISFGLFVARQINARTMLVYWIVQLLGATTAAFVAQTVQLKPNPSTFIEAGTPALDKLTSLPQGILAETIGTFFLMFVFMGTVIDKRAPKVGGLFIGLAVSMGVFAIGPITGAALSPARWFGPAIITGNLSNTVLYTVGPLLGAGLAGVLYPSLLEEKLEEA